MFGTAEACSVYVWAPPPMTERKSTRPEAASRLAARPDQLGDLLGFQLVRHLAMDALRDLRRRQQRARNLGVGLRTPSQVRELREDQTAVRVDPVGERAVARDDGVVVVGNLLPGGGRRRGVDARGPAEDRERAATPGLGLVVAPEPLGRPTALRHGFGVTGGIDAVLQ